MILGVAIGTLGQWFTVGTAVIIAWLVYKGGGGVALGVLQEANDVLEKRVHELERARHDDEKTIAALRARTDFAEAVRPLVDAVFDHEQRAAERFEKTTVLLQLIADRLGPDDA